MAMYTPKHGRIIEFPLEYGLTLLARLGTVSPVKVLRTVEGLDFVPGLLSVCTVTICFVCRATPLQISVAVFVTAAIGSIITTFGLFLIPMPPTFAAVYSGKIPLFSFWDWFTYPLLRHPVVGILIRLFIVGWNGVWSFLIILATLYSKIAGWGIVFFVVSLIGLFIVGWKGVLAFLIGRAVAEVVHFLLTVIKGKRLRKRFGFGPIGSAEINFLHAYQLYAADQGISTDICVTPEEIDAGSWRNCAVRLREEWPEGKILVEWS